MNIKFEVNFFSSSGIGTASVNILGKITCPITVQDSFIRGRFFSSCHLSRYLIGKENQTTLLFGCIAQAQVCLISPELPYESLCNFPSLQSLMLNFLLELVVFKVCIEAKLLKIKS